MARSLLDWYDAIPIKEWVLGGVSLNSSDNNKVVLPVTPGDCYGVSA